MSDFRQRLVQPFRRLPPCHSRFLVKLVTRAQQAAMIEMMGNPMGAAQLAVCSIAAD